MIFLKNRHSLWEGCLFPRSLAPLSLRPCALVVHEALASVPSRVSRASGSCRRMKEIHGSLWRVRPEKQCFWEPALQRSKGRVTAWIRESPRRVVHNGWKLPPSHSTGPNPSSSFATSGPPGDGGRMQGRRCTGRAPDAQAGPHHPARLSSPPRAPPGSHRSGRQRPGTRTPREWEEGEGHGDREESQKRENGR